MVDMGGGQGGLPQAQLPIYPWLRPWGYPWGHPWGWGGPWGDPWIAAGGPPQVQQAQQFQPQAQQPQMPPQQPQQLPMPPQQMAGMGGGQGGAPQAQLQRPNIWFGPWWSRDWWGGPTWTNPSWVNPWIVAGSQPQVQQTLQPQMQQPQAAGMGGAAQGPS